MCRDNQESADSTSGNVADYDAQQIFTLKRRVDGRISCRRRTKGSDGAPRAGIRHGRLLVGRGAAWFY